MGRIQISILAFQCKYAKVLWMHVVMPDGLEVFQALSDSTRLRIVRLLAATQDEACLCELVDCLDEAEYNVSRHLKVLRNSGLLSAEKEGRWIYHRLVSGSEIFQSLAKCILLFPDHRGVFDADRKRFSARIPIRSGGRCRTPSSTSESGSRAVES